MRMSKNFEYLSVSKGHHKASLGTTQNSTFVARVLPYINLFSVFCGAFIGFLCHTETKAINKRVAEKSIITKAINKWVMGDLYLN